MRRSRIKTSFPRQKIGLILIVVGLVCFGIFSLSFSRPTELKPELKKEALSEFYPGQIIIPKIKINLPVLPAKIINDEWEIPAAGAAYLLGSGIPGQPGNPVIYGHNKNKLLGPVRWLEKNDEIKLINQKGQEFIYQVVETKTVTSKSIEVLLPSEEAILTLYTCSGVLDSQRFVVVAKLKV